eukprot:6210088-Pleurochrysis_carterae.AAC.2
MRLAIPSATRPVESVTDVCMHGGLRGSGLSAAATTSEAFTELFRFAVAVTVAVGGVVVHERTAHTDPDACIFGEIACNRLVMTSRGRRAVATRAFRLTNDGESCVGCEQEAALANLPQREARLGVVVHGFVKSEEVDEIR